MMVIGTLCFARIVWHKPENADEKKMPSKHGTGEQMKYRLTIEGDFKKGECEKCPISCEEFVEIIRTNPFCPLEEATVAKNATVEGEWIPVSERLPEDENTMYWTTHEDGSLVMHGYSKAHGFIYNWTVHDLEKRKRQGGVIAWMPLSLPEPYKKGGN